MTKVFSNIELNVELLQELRHLAERGATVRELVTAIQSGLGLAPDALIPVLWYLTSAFNLSLREVLPVREWLGTDNDEEINAIILPAIEHAKQKWAG